MYKREEIINGILCHKSSPDGDWEPYTIEQLSNLVVSQDKELTDMQAKYNELLDSLAKLAIGHDEI